MANHAHGKKGRRGIVAAVVVSLVLVAAVCACAAIVILRPAFAESALETLGVPAIGIGANSSGAGPSASSSNELHELTAANDVAPTDEEVAAAKEQEALAKRTPLLARCAGVDIRSSIAPADITGILFHQASYEYALPLETELPEADYETVADTRVIPVNNAQTEGEWLDAEVLHLWRTDDDTDMDTSIDLGALPGTTVRAPVDGTVVLVRDYMLYDEMPDIEIHIQPEGRPDLDCVLIHTTDPLVKAGDRVRAGVTPLSKVRDIEAWLTDVQLGFFLPEGVGGNHTHIQMNDTTFEDYREKKLKDAITVSE